MELLRLSIGALLAGLLWLQTAGAADGLQKELPKSVDLRPELDRFSLAPRQQGSRPTCSVFTVVGAIEFAVAKRQGADKTA
ncbi:MAG: hypothetical protein QHJ82_09955 [Verrucomicrobiota bacterium]|nr:hypothetical protein [Verrucomicrobiota bacterium]